MPALVVVVRSFQLIWASVKGFKSDQLIFCVDIYWEVAPVDSAFDMRSRSVQLTALTLERVPISSQLTLACVMGLRSFQLMPASVKCIKVSPN